MTPPSGASSPTNEPPELISRPRDLSDDDEDNYAQQRSGNLPRKKGGYDSRIEQILYEHPDLQIVITDAGKSHESGGSYIVYTIRTGVCCKWLGHVQGARTLTTSRMWKSDDDTLNSIRCELPSSAYILPSLSLPYPKSIQWPTTLRSPPKPKRT